MFIEQFMTELIATKPGLTPFRPYVIGMRREVMPIIFEDNRVGAAADIFINDLGMAHHLVQELEGDPIADYLHGIIHRREGDFANANYWFRRAKTVTDHIKTDPEELTKQVEKSEEVSDELHEKLLDEWKLLTTYIINKS